MPCDAARTILANLQGLAAGDLRRMMSAARGLWAIPIFKMRLRRMAGKGDEHRDAARTGKELRQTGSEPVPVSGLLRFNNRKAPAALALTVQSADPIVPIGACFVGNGASSCPTQSKSGHSSCQPRQPDRVSA